MSAAGDRDAQHSLNRADVRRRRYGIPAWLRPPPKKLSKPRIRCWESDLSDPVVEWFRAKGMISYAEVPRPGEFASIGAKRVADRWIPCATSTPGADIDLVFVRWRRLKPTRVVAVELKVRADKTALRQASKNREGNKNVYHEVGYMMGLNRGKGLGQANFILIARDRKEDRLEKKMGFNLKGISQIRFKESIDLEKQLVEYIQTYYGLSDE